MRLRGGQGRRTRIMTVYFVRGFALWAACCSVSLRTRVGAYSSCGGRANRQGFRRAMPRYRHRNGVIVGHSSFTLGCLARTMAALGGGLIRMLDDEPRCMRRVGQGSGSSLRRQDVRWRR